MSNRRVMIYLPDGLRESAEAGQHNFIGKVQGVLEQAGMTVVYAPESDVDAADPEDYALVHMLQPPHGRALTMRRVYHYPFWAIDCTDRRWAWHVARTAFDPTDVPRKEADRFHRFWRKRLFDGITPTREGFVYLPLQGKLTEHRSFQICSPIEMVCAVLEQADRPVIATLHPKEIYSRADRDALNQLATHPRLTIETGGMAQWLARCDMVVTQNSSAGFNGFFLNKPCVLFARIDFHHIALNVADLGVPEALAAAETVTPDYAGYVHWFWQRMSINAGRPEAEEAIRVALRRDNWPV